MQSEYATQDRTSSSLTDVLDRMPEGLVVVDAGDDMVYRNPAAAQIMGNVPPAHLVTYAGRLDEGITSEIELSPLRFVEVTVVLVPWLGQPARLVTLRDVTERRRRQSSLVVLTEELRTANAHLQMLADVDALTGMLNRRGLKRVLESEILPRMRLGFDLVAIMVDCDEFKTVNDTYDHAAGDSVLRQVGERLRSALRPGDPLARVGGDEFLVLLPGARHTDALRVANRIRDLVARSPVPIPWAGGEVGITVSIGVAQIPRHVRDIDDIIQRTDARLRQSKLSGKNRVTGPSRIGEAERETPAG